MIVDVIAWMWDNHFMEPQDRPNGPEPDALSRVSNRRVSLTFEIPYYKPDDIQGHYAKKFLASVEKNIAETKARLEELSKTIRPRQAEGHNVAAAPRSSISVLSLPSGTKPASACLSLRANWRAKSLKT